MTLDELYAFVEGRSVTNDLRGLVELRKKEFDEYRKGLPPPERFMTTGACGIYFLFPQVLSDLDLLKELEVCMYMYMYVCTCICMYVHMYVHVYVCMYICMYVCTYVCTCICMLYICTMYVCMYICTCIFIQYVCMYMDIYVYNICVSICMFLRLKLHQILMY